MRSTTTTTTAIANHRPGPLTRTDRNAIAAAWEAEREAARRARRRGEPDAEWAHLERAHILSQPSPLRHVRTHAAMLASGARRLDAREVPGQVVRLLVAAPASATGRYPLGNTGGARVAMRTPMSIPDDLRELLGAGPHAG